VLTWSRDLTYPYIDADKFLMYSEKNDELMIYLTVERSGLSRCAAIHFTENSFRYFEKQLKEIYGGSNKNDIDLYNRGCQAMRERVNKWVIYGEDNLPLYHITDLRPIFGYKLLKAWNGYEEVYDIKNGESENAPSGKNPENERYGVSEATKPTAGYVHVTCMNPDPNGPEKLEFDVPDSKLEDWMKKWNVNATYQELQTRMIESDTAELQSGGVMYFYLNQP